MAYVADIQDDQDQQTGTNGSEVVNQPVQLSNGGASLQSNVHQAGGSGNGLTSVSTPASENPSHSGTFTNLQTYLNANQSGANNLAGTLGNNLTNTIGTAKDTINQQGDAFNNAVNTGTNTYDQSIVDSALNNPVSFLNSPQLQQLATMKAGQYAGPSSFEGSGFANTAQGAQLKAQQQAGLASSTGGRETLLSENNKSTPYTQGGLSLDQYLIQDTPTALSAVTTAAQPAGDLSNLFNTTQATGDTNVTNATNTSAQTGQKVTNALNTGLSDYRQQIDNAVSGAQQAQTTNQNNLTTSFTPTTNTDKTQSYNVTPDQLTAAGITQDQWNQLVQMNNQAISLGHNGVNLGNYLTNTPGQFTEGSVATPDQQAYYNALMQIAGGGQALTTGGTSGGSAYNLSDAYNALLAQLGANAPTGVGPAGTTTTSTGTNAATATGGVGGLITIAKQISDILNKQQQQANLQKITDEAEAMGKDYTGLDEQLAAGTLDLSGALAALNAEPVIRTPTITVSGPVDANGVPIDDTGSGNSLNNLQNSNSTSTTSANGSNIAGAGASAAGSALGSLGASNVGNIVITDEAGNIITQTGANAAGDAAASGAASSGANAAGSTALGTAGQALAVVGAAYSIYNAIDNYQSGAGGTDTLNGATAGASTGAAIGSIVPGIGTVVGAVVGAVIGGVVGAISSAFGPGREDPENVSWNEYAADYDKDPSLVAQATPSQAYQMLAGIFDSRGTQIPFYNTFGRMGEGAFLQGMTSQINTAIKNGTISNSASPQQIYNSVVAPWIATMGAWPDTSTVKGSPEKAAVQNLLTQLITQYQAGQNSSWTGIDGTVPSVVPYGQLTVPVVKTNPVISNNNSVRKAGAV